MIEMMLKGGAGVQTGFAGELTLPMILLAFGVTTTVDLMIRMVTPP